MYEYEYECCFVCLSLEMCVRVELVFDVIPVRYQRGDRGRGFAVRCPSFAMCAITFFVIFALVPCRQSKNDCKKTREGGMVYMYQVPGIGCGVANLLVYLTMVDINPTAAPRVSVPEGPMALILFYFL